LLPPPPGAGGASKRKIRFSNPLSGRMSGYGKMGLKLGAAGLGGALIGSLIKNKIEQNSEALRQQEMIGRQARSDMLDLVGRREYKQSIEADIQRNLGRLQAEAPDLYMRVAAGRVLPQGAVVIGGAPRSDLLNELGMAMANGQFNG
jgi:hypothetical protein